MAFKMKGSPHKRGTIEGTANSPVHLGGLLRVAKVVYKGAKKLFKNKRPTNRTPTPQHRPHGPQRGSRNPDGTRR